MVYDLKNISTGIGFLLKPELEVLLPLSTLPALDVATLLVLPLLRTPVAPIGDTSPRPLIISESRFRRPDGLSGCGYRERLELEGESNPGDMKPLPLFRLDEEEALLPRFFVDPLKYWRNLADAPRRPSSSRMEASVEELHLERRTLPEGPLSRSSASSAARRAASPWAMSAWRLIGETGRERRIGSSSSSKLNWKE